MLTFRGKSLLPRQNTTKIPFKPLHFSHPVKPGKCFWNLAMLTSKGMSRTSITKICVGRSQHDYKRFLMCSIYPQDLPGGLLGQPWQNTLLKRQVAPSSATPPPLPNGIILTGIASSCWPRPASVTSFASSNSPIGVETYSGRCNCLAIRWKPWSTCIRLQSIKKSS